MIPKVEMNVSKKLCFQCSWRDVTIAHVQDALLRPPLPKCAKEQMRSKGFSPFLSSFLFPDCAASLDDAKFVMMDDVNGADNELDHLAAFLCAASKSVMLHSTRTLLKSSWGHLYSLPFGRLKHVQKQGTLTQLYVCTCPRVWTIASYGLVWFSIKFCALQEIAYVCCNALVRSMVFGFVYRKLTL